MTDRASKAVRGEGLLDRLSILLDDVWPVLIHAAVVLGVLYLIAPLIVVTGTSFNKTAIVFPPSDWSLEPYSLIPRSMYEAFFTSFRLGLISTALATLLAVPGALAIVRGWVPGRAITEAFFRMPIQVPAIVIGLSFFQYYTVLQRDFDFLPYTLRGSFEGLVIGHTLLVTPFMLVVVLARAAALRPTMEEASYGLGAGFIRTTFQITLPLLKPAIIAGAFVAFIISFDDVAVSLFLVGAGDSTLPVTMLGVAEAYNPPFLYAAANLTVVFAMMLALFVQRVVGVRTVFSV